MRVTKRQDFIKINVVLNLIINRKQCACCDSMYKNVQGQSRKAKSIDIGNSGYKRYRTKENKKQKKKQKTKQKNKKTKQKTPQKNHTHTKQKTKLMSKNGPTQNRGKGKGEGG
jgi:hypothetical protein